MPLEVALAVRPPNQIIKRLVVAGVVILVGIGCFSLGTTVGKAEQARFDAAEFTAWRNTNACIGIPGFLQRDNANVVPYPKKHGLE